MKASLIVISLLMSFNFLTFTYAQGLAAIPTVYLNPSPSQTGLGWTGVSYPNDDPFGFYYNPAMLGYSSQYNNISTQFYTGKVEWLPDIGGDLSYNNFAFNLGYNFKNELNGLRLSLGMGYIYSKFDLGNFYSVKYPPGTAFEGYDSFNAYGIGIALDYKVLFSLGITFKNIHSQSTGIPESDLRGPGIAAINAIDYGILLSVPVMKLIDDKCAVRLNKNSRLKPVINYSVGYSRLNIGDEVRYSGIDYDQADPLPLTARLGYTINLGINSETDNLSLNLINYNMILEADDILVEYDTLGRLSYQGLFGDIDVGKHLIQLKGDDKVVVHKGYSISFVETVTILAGSFHGRGYGYVPKTGGVIVSTRGLFKWLNSQLEMNFSKFLVDHIELRYIHSTMFQETNPTYFSSISLSFINYSFD